MWNRKHGIKPTKSGLNRGECVTRMPLGRSLPAVIMVAKWLAKNKYVTSQDYTKPCMCS